MASKEHVVRVYHQAARSQLGLLVLPFVVMGVHIYALLQVNNGYRACEATGGTSMMAVPLTWWAVAIAGPLLFVLWGLVKARFFHRYVVTLDSLQADEGLLRRNSASIKLGDLHHIDVQQNIAQRLLFTGDVVFSTGESGGAGVRFANVSKPKAVRQLVSDMLDRMRSGAQLTSDEPDRVEEARPSAKKSPAKSLAKSTSSATAKPATKAASAATAASGDEDRDELYRLLAAQESEGKTDNGEDS